jgi:tRNA (guanine37-N1)-methyltransferase
MNFHIITIFPQILDSYFNESIIKRAQKNKIINIKIHNLRDWADDKRKTVDDTPYGGGAGMIMKIEPIYKALNSPLLREAKGIKSKIILLSAKGQTWKQQLAKKYSKLDKIIFVCGRYEGIDERVKELVDEEISIGDYILTGGELGTAVIIDSITRLLPGALGNSKSPQEESHSLPGILEYPQYTRPEIFKASPFCALPLDKNSQGRLKMVKKIKKLTVPKVLLSGNHNEINIWRKSKMKSKKSRKNPK